MLLCVCTFEAEVFQKLMIMESRVKQRSEVLIPSNSKHPFVSPVTFRIKFRQ